MRVHDLKTDADIWDAVDLHVKKAELRLNDRDYQVGDILRLIPIGNPERDGCRLYRRVTHVLQGGQYGLAEGYVMLSIAPCSPREIEQADAMMEGLIYV